MVTDTSSGPYPVEHLVGCRTALILFAAGFLGINDACWIADAGLRATCVDLDGERLSEMQPMFPKDWTFVRGDAYRNAGFSPMLKVESQWDVVSCDPFTNQFEKCADNVDEWCRFARHVVILGTGTHTVVEAPDGWRVADKIRRTDYAGGVFWTTLVRS